MPSSIRPGWLNRNEVDVGERPPPPNKASAPRSASKLVHLQLAAINGSLAEWKSAEGQGCNVMITMTPFKLSLERLDIERRLHGYCTRKVVILCAKELCWGRGKSLMSRIVCKCCWSHVPVIMPRLRPVQFHFRCVTTCLGLDNPLVSVTFVHFKPFGIKR